MQPTLADTKPIIRQPGQIGFKMFEKPIEFVFDCARVVFDVGPPKYEAEKWSVTVCIDDVSALSELESAVCGLVLSNREAFGLQEVSEGKVLTMQHPLTKEHKGKRQLSFKVLPKATTVTSGVDHAGE